MTLDYTTTALLFTDVRQSAGDAQLYLLLRMFTIEEHRKVLDILRYDLLVKTKNSKMMLYDIPVQQEVSAAASAHIEKTIEVIERSLLGHNPRTVPAVHSDIINSEQSIPSPMRSLLAQQLKLIPKELEEELE